MGSEGRLFAAHEDVLSNSPYFASLCQHQFYEHNKRIELPEIEPEIFSSVLEYMYKGDYYPRLEFDKRRHSWLLEDANDAAARSGTIEITLLDNGIPVRILKDTVIYVSRLKSFVALHQLTLSSALQRSLVFQSFSHSHFASRACNLGLHAAPS